MSKKQTTLFQSWGNKGKSSIEPDHVANPLPAVEPIDNDVIDLCGSFEDDDDDLLCEVEESVADIQNNIDSTKLFQNNLCSSSVRHDSTDDHQNVCDISIGADGFTPTQAQTQYSNLPGFDKCAGKLWIYPTNYPVREYQFNIVQQALFKNTMVTLPTGLGKTFVAAVVMYNFYRWYPQGKVIFMAPTKPLVAQQIEACYNIMGIPQDHTAEMTGSMGPSKREKAWHEKRVFFLTPQVLTNDLSRGSCPAMDVKCLVIDEAHKALGNHAYCQVVRELVKYTENFRILALSATPGSDIKAVQQVLNNLLISQIEIRTEESADIKKYSHERKVDKVVVPLGDELTKVKAKYIHIMDVVVNRLKRLGVLYNKDTTSLSKFLILKAREAFRQNPPERLQRNQYGIVEGDFAMAMSLYHGYELLQLHGSRSLYNFLDGILTGDKSYGRTRTELTRNADFNELMGILSSKFAAGKGEDGEVKPAVLGHPKMEKLQEIVLDHFNTHADATTRVMIFSQYRDSVQEITDMLRLHQPLVKSMSFIGQASTGKATKGFTQKEQLKVMKQFREGGYNTLVSTCVGEEGLDIGDVDLIICFDAHKSPIRLVQRMGRTGRKREGRIVMLVTQGKEEQIYNQSQYSKKSIHKAILNGAKSLHFYQHSPRMLPDGLNPTCHKMHITVRETFKPTKKISTDKDLNQSKITTMMAEVSSKKDEPEEVLTLEEYRELEPWLVPELEIPKLPVSTLVSLTNAGEIENQEPQGTFLSLSEWSPWQSTLQETEHIDHSLGSKHLVQIMEFVELQQSLDPKDDPYGLEMAAYLNKDDVLEADETEAPSLLKFGVQKKNDDQPTTYDKGKKTSIKSKSRRSDNLPKFDFLHERADENSDDDLPAFIVDDNAITDNMRDIDEKSGDTDTGLHDERVKKKSVVDNLNKKHGDKSEEMRTAGNNDSASLRRKIKSKAKLLEKRMSVNKVRKRKRSRHTSGQTSMIQLIAENDSTDFDDDLPVITADANNEKKDYEIQDMHKTMASTSKLTGNDNSGDSASVGSENCVLLDCVDDFSRECFRIRTPPSLEDAAKVCEAIEAETETLNIDLVALIDEWHMENREGKYIIYPSNMLDKNGLSHKKSGLSSGVKGKMSVSKDIVKLSNSINETVNKSCKKSGIAKSVMEPVVDSPCKYLKSELPCGSLKISDKEFLADNRDKSVDPSRTEMLNSSQERKLGKKKLFKSPNGSEEQTRLENEISPETNKMSKISPVAKVDDDIICTGNFILDADDAFEFDNDLGDDDLSNEDLMPVIEYHTNKDENFEEKQRKENDAVSCNDIENAKSLNDRCEKHSINLNESEIKFKNDQIICNIAANKDCVADILSDRSPSSSSETNEMNESVSLPFTNNNKTSYDSFFADDMDDHLFKERKTPSLVTKALNQSTQITFTQALDFVHSGSRASVSESCSEEQDRELDKLSLNQETPHKKKNENTENGSSISPKFGLKRSQRTVNSAKPREEKEESDVEEEEMDTVDSPVAEVIGRELELEEEKDAEVSVKCAYVSEDDGEMPVFDLGFDFDEDIIPPSPKASQSSLKPARNRLSQTFALRNMTSQSNSLQADDSELETAGNGKEECDYENDNNLKVNKGDIRTCLSRRPLKLHGGGKKQTSEHQEPVRRTEEESQSLLGTTSDKVLESKRNLKSYLGQHCLEPIDENYENFNDESNCIDDKNFKNEQTITFTNKEKLPVDENKIENIMIGTGTFNTSFALLEEDLDDWIDSGTDNQNVNIDEGVKKDVTKGICSDQTKVQKENMRPGVLAVSKMSETPIAVVSPISLSQEVKNKIGVGHDSKSLGIHPNESKSKIVRKSMFQVADISLDDFDDSFNLTNDRQTCKTTPQTVVNPLPHKQCTSTPVLTPCKISRVTPFGINAASSTPVNKPNNSPDKVKELTPSISRSMLSNAAVSILSPMDSAVSEENDQSKQNESTDHDESFIIRRKKKVQVIDSPFSQAETVNNLQKNKNEDQNENMINVKGNNGKKRKKILFSASEDDNDFDDSILLEKQNYGIKKAKPPVLQFSSDEDFEGNCNHNMTDWKSASREGKSKNDIELKENKNQNVKIRKGGTRKRPSNPFIEDEAELSEEDCGVSSDDEEGSDLDVYEGSFISDSQSTQSQALNNTDVHALYLKSVKSPLAQRGGYKLQYNYRQDVDVFSQRPEPEESHYMEDSFCVGSEEDDWLRGEGEEEDEDEHREVTMMQNSLMFTGRKRRKGMQAFQTSRQRAIEMGRMKALNKIRSKLAGKATGTDRRQMNVASASDNDEKDGADVELRRNVPKRNRIKVKHDTSSDEENQCPVNTSNASTFVSPKMPVANNSKKRARLIVSSDDSENEDFIESKILNKSNKSVRISDQNDEQKKEAGNYFGDNKNELENGNKSAEEIRKERLMRQREKQAEFKRQLEGKTIKNPKSSVNLHRTNMDNDLTKIKDKSVYATLAKLNDENDFAKPIKEVAHNDPDMLISSNSSRSKFQEKLVILVDSKEISGSQDIISSLRFKHGIQVSAAQLPGCDYIISNRMAVERKQWSEFSNGANRAKLIERLQHLGELFDRPCLVVEKDRIKPGEEKSSKPVHWTKYVDRTISMLHRSEVKVLFTENFDETAELLAELCRLELRKNMGINVKVDLNDDQLNRVRFFASLPKLSYIHALNLSEGFRSVSEFLKSSAVLIESRGKMSKNRAIEVFNFVRRNFDPNLLPTNHK